MNCSACENPIETTGINCVECGQKTHENCGSLIAVPKLDEGSQDIIFYCLRCKPPAHPFSPNCTSVENSPQTSVKAQAIDYASSYSETLSQIEFDSKVLPKFDLSNILLNRISNCIPKRLVKASWRNFLKSRIKLHRTHIPGSPVVKYAVVIIRLPNHDKGKHCFGSNSYRLESLRFQKALRGLSSLILSLTTTKNSSISESTIHICSRLGRT